MVTKEALDSLRAARPQTNAHLDYTIGGTIETHVHSCVEAERIGQLNAGERTLRQALQEMRQNQALGFRQGLAKAQFNHSHIMQP